MSVVSATRSRSHLRGAASTHGSFEVRGSDSAGATTNVGAIAIRDDTAALQRSVGGEWARTRITDGLSRENANRSGALKASLPTTRPTLRPASITFRGSRGIRGGCFVEARMWVAGHDTGIPLSQA